MQLSKVWASTYSTQQQRLAIIAMQLQCSSLSHTKETPFSATKLCIVTLYGGNLNFALPSQDLTILPLSE